MKLNGTMINAYFVCKRKCYLLANRICVDDENEKLAMGKAMHEATSIANAIEEVLIDGVRVDALTDEYLIEKKKSNTNHEGAKWQLLYYLKLLRNYGIERIGCLLFLDTGEEEFYHLDEKDMTYLEQLEIDIEKLVSSDVVPDCLSWTGCKHCAYWSYCKS